MIQVIKNSMRTILNKDPSAKSKWATLFYPSTKVQVYHHLARKLYLKEHHFLSSIVSLRARKITGIDLHPGAKIGQGLFIDHGMGVVVGETVILEDNVTLYHGVTLGGVGKEVEKRRHPKLEEGVTVGAGATILGPITIGRNAKIGAGSVVLIDVPENATAVGSPARIIQK